MHKFQLSQKRLKRVQFESCQLVIVDWCAGYPSLVVSTIICISNSILPIRRLPYLLDQSWVCIQLHGIRILYPSELRFAEKSSSCILHKTSKLSVVPHGYSLIIMFWRRDCNLLKGCKSCRHQGWWTQNWGDIRQISSEDARLQLRGTIVPTVFMEILTI